MFQFQLWSLKESHSITLLLYFNAGRIYVQVLIQVSENISLENVTRFVSIIFFNLTYLVM